MTYGTSVCDKHDDCEKVPAMCIFCRRAIRAMVYLTVGESPLEYAHFGCAKRRGVFGPQ